MEEGKGWRRGGKGREGGRGGGGRGRERKP